MHQSPEPIKDLFAAEAIDPNGGVGFGRINCRSRRERRNPVREEISCIINRRNAAWTGSAGGACGAPQELPPPCGRQQGPCPCAADRMGPMAPWGRGCASRQKDKKNHRHLRQGAVLSYPEIRFRPKRRPPALPVQVHAGRYLGSITLKVSVSE